MNDQQEADMAALSAKAKDARGVANVMEELWRSAEDECAKLASGVWPSDEAIAEAFHEHRCETNSRLPPWSEVQKNSGIWIYSHNFVARLRSLPVAANPVKEEQ